MATPAEEIKDPVDGIGCSRKRKEDARFIQGKGNYTDDLKLPGTVFGAFVRSPIAHGRVVSINKEPALAHPGVLAVLTAEDLAPLSLHWMPTLAGDKQMVLADGKVCFQQQEVAFVIAEDRYVAADAIELVEVEYEELPVIIDGRRAMDDDAPVIRSPDHGQRGHQLPARTPLPARDLRLRIQLRQNQRRANRLPDLAGAARGPHRRVDAVGHCRE
jgi:carbon-monoxide dehydrogenase large subunit